MSKQLPMPKLVIMVTEIPVDNETQGQILVDILKDHQIQAKLKYKTYMNCFECPHRRGLKCEYDLSHDECPIGELFNHTPDKYDKIVQELLERGYYTTLLDPIYKKIQASQR